MIDEIARSSCRPGRRPTISVLMAAYNAEAFVEEALRSLLEQTISNIEIVVVNDASTDGTLQHIESVARSDSRILVINSEENMGPVGARNLALRYCRAPYIGSMDADDVALSCRLEKQLNYLDRHPEIAVVGGMMVSIDSEGRQHELLGGQTLPTNPRAVVRSLELGPPCAHIWLARRQVYDALSGYREIHPGEDYDFLLRAFSAGFGLCNVPEVVMKIRISSGQTSSQLALQQRKAQRYIVKLHRARMKGRGDGFSPSSFEKVVASSWISEYLHRAAVRSVRKAYVTRNWLLRALYVAEAAILSPGKCTISSIGSGQEWCAAEN